MHGPLQRWAAVQLHENLILRRTIAASDRNILPVFHAVKGPYTARRQIILAGNRRQLCLTVWQTKRRRPWLCYHMSEQRHLPKTIPTYSISTPLTAPSFSRKHIEFIFTREVMGVGMVTLLDLTLLPANTAVTYGSVLSNPPTHVEQFRHT